MSVLSNFLEVDIAYVIVIACLTLSRPTFQTSPQGKLTPSRTVPKRHIVETSAKRYADMHASENLKNQKSPTELLCLGLPQKLSQNIQQSSRLGAPSCCVDCHRNLAFCRASN